MYPHERSLVVSYKGRPFALLGVNSDGDRERVKQIIDTERIIWRSWLDGSTQGPISTAWQIEGWPSIYLIDHRGIIRYAQLRDEALDKMIERLVSEAEKDR